jgi:hypothetical protein
LGEPPANCTALEVFYIVDSVVLADVLLDLEPMWYGLITDPLAKAFRPEEEGHLRLGNLV